MLKIIFFYNFLLKQFCYYLYNFYIRKNRRHQLYIFKLNNNTLSVNSTKQRY